MTFLSKFSCARVISAPSPGAFPDSIHATASRINARLSFPSASCTLLSVSFCANGYALFRSPKMRIVSLDAIRLAITQWKVEPAFNSRESISSPSNPIKTGFTPYAQA